MRVRVLEALLPALSRGRGCKSTGDAACGASPTHLGVESALQVAGFTLASGHSFPQFVPVARKRLPQPSCHYL